MKNSPLSPKENPRYSWSALLVISFFLLNSFHFAFCPFTFLRDIFYKHLYNYKSKTFIYDDLNNLKNFAFMPLLLQPEENIDLVSTRYNNQIETARQVAMSLPADMNLVVKDHPYMNEKRPTSYLEKIKFLLNVKLINSRIPNWRIFEKTKIVIAASGTSVFEASILNMPIIQLGDLGTIRMLPNVHHHADIKNLKQKIFDVLKKKINEKDSYKSMLEYVHAAFEKGLKYNMWNDKIINDSKLKKQLFNSYCLEIERLTKLKV